MTKDIKVVAVVVVEDDIVVIEILLCSSKFRVQIDLSPKTLGQTYPSRKIFVHKF